MGLDEGQSTQSLSQLFFENGYHIEPDLIDEQECDDLLTSILGGRASSGRAGIRNLMSTSEVSRVACDGRLTGLAGELTGQTLVPYKATLFEKTGKANWLVAWHQDTALPVEAAVEGNGWGPNSVKESRTFSHAPTRALAKVLALRIHLDASTPENGPLRVIAGSHHERLSEDDFAEWTKKKSIECLVGKGGVLAMSPLLLHASSKCLTDKPRQVLHIEYAMSLDIDTGVRLAVA